MGVVVNGDRSKWLVLVIHRLQRKEVFQMGWEEGVVVVEGSRGEGAGRFVTAARDLPAGTTVLRLQSI